MAQSEQTGEIYRQNSLKRKLQNGQIRYFLRGKVMTIRFKGTKNVFLLSSIDGASMIRLKK